MPLLLRYLLRELLVPLVVWVAFFFVLMFMLQFLRGPEVLLGSAVRVQDLARLVLYMGPQFLVMALPIGLLLAILVGLGRLADDRELTALQSVGVGPAKLLVAPLAVGLLITLAMSLLVFRGVPWGRTELKVLVNGIIKRNVAGDVKAGVFYEDLTQLTLYAEGVDREGGRWEHVLLHDDRDADAPLLVLARRGSVSAGKAEVEALELRLEEGQVHRANVSGDDYAVVDFERGQIALGVDGAAASGKRRFRSPREELTPEELLEAARQAGDEREARSFRMAFHWRLGHALMPLAFALLGTALAVGRRGAGRGQGFVLSIAAYIAFYIVFRAFEQMGNRGELPPVLATQLANLLFALVGGALLWHHSRRGAGA
ncbi:MAG: LptF/LptG family permease [Myxococcaceae bacterium]|nr:LptF/LptG family permease [Myxococcaceae bacterium]MCI0669776.1 LptF/LptG family permease [Myxococcaceae bacterium]